MDMSGHEMRFIVASVLAHRLAARYGVSDEVMTEEYARSLATMLAAEQGDAEASLLMVAAQETIATQVKAIRDGRRDKPVQ